MDTPVTDFLGELDYLDWVLLILSVGMLLVFFVPVTVSAAGILLMRYRLSEVDNEVRSVHPDGTNPEYTARFEELEGMGFRPVGSVYEEFWLYGHELYKCFPVRILISPDGLRLQRCTTRVEEESSD